MTPKLALMDSVFDINRREFVRTLTGCTAAAGALALGVPASPQEKEKPPEVETNIAEFLKVPKTAHSLPGPFPGRVVKVTDPHWLANDKVDAKVVAEMFEKGIRTLTGTTMKKSFVAFFTRDDVVGVKVNPVGPPLISTRPEVAEALIRWLVNSKLPRRNIVIWDRFDLDLKDAGFTPDRFPGARPHEGEHPVAAPAERSPAHEREEAVEEEAVDEVEDPEVDCEEAEHEKGGRQRDQDARQSPLWVGEELPPRSAPHHPGGGERGARGHHQQHHAAQCVQTHRRQADDHDEDVQGQGSASARELAARTWSREHPRLGQHERDRAPVHQRAQDRGEDQRVAHREAGDPQAPH